MANDSSSDQLSDYYQALEHQAKLQREAANAERERIIKLLEQQDVCDFCEIIELIKGDNN